MAFWPTDERIKRPALVKRHGLVNEQNRNYPNLEPGLMGAATLLKDENAQFNWAFVNTPSEKIEDRKTPLKLGKQVDVFPPTCKKPIQNAQRSAKKRAEHGANFLRTFLPDVEIASELIRDQLVEETTLVRDLERFDPYSGNLLEVYEPQNTSDTAFLIFPMGETKRDLNISSISYPEATGVVFKPSATPSYTFPTPIQQIVATKYQDDANLVVRTYSSVQLFGLKQHPNIPSKLAIVDLVSFSRADVADEVIVDIKHLSSSPGLLAVGDGGTVFTCTVGDGRKSVNAIHQSHLSSTLSDQEFWRLSTGSDPHTYFVMSSENVWRHDIRANSTNDFLSLTNGKHLLTSVEDYGNDSILRLSTTSQVIWTDARFPNRPLLAYSHGREYDRYLSVCTVDCGSNNRSTFLTTRNNALTTIYDVSWSVEKLVQLDILPYSLASEVSMYHKHVGQQFVFRGNSVGLVRLSERGAVEYSELLSSSTESQVSYTVEMTQEVRNLAAENVNPHADVGPQGLQEFSQLDLHPTYDDLFRQHFLDKESDQEIAESTYQLLSYFPFYMQNKDVPIEHMLTTYDIAFRAGSEPDCYSRADFLAESPVNTNRGYRALKQGHLSPQLVKSLWHRSILPILRRLDAQFPEDPVRSMEYLQTFNLADNECRSSKSRQHELDACQQLTLDLALSSDVYSENSFSKPNEVGQSLEVMTEALSLVDEPPPVVFGYLKPSEKLLVSEGAQKTLETSIGVRLLLQDWDTSDPVDYVYQDPYHGTTSLESFKPPKPTAPWESNLYVQNQRPPQVIASSVAVVATPEITRRIVPKVQSQDPFVPHATLGYTSLGRSTSFSQDLNVSTQVLPGPHGGRPGAKKKPAKKRLGGF